MLFATLSSSKANNSLVPLLEGKSVVIPKEAHTMLWVYSWITILLALPGAVVGVVTLRDLYKKKRELKDVRKENDH